MGTIFSKLLLPFQLLGHGVSRFCAVVRNFLFPPRQNDGSDCEHLLTVDNDPPCYGTLSPWSGIGEEQALFKTMANRIKALEARTESIVNKLGGAGTYSSCDNMKVAVRLKRSFALSPSEVQRLVNGYLSSNSSRVDLSIAADEGPSASSSSTHNQMDPQSDRATTRTATCSVLEDGGCIVDVQTATTSNDVPHCDKDATDSPYCKHHHSENLPFLSTFLPDPEAFREAFRNDVQEEQSMSNKNKGKNNINIGGDLAKPASNVSDTLDRYSNPCTVGVEMYLIEERGVSFADRQRSSNIEDVPSNSQIEAITNGKQASDSRAKPSDSKLQQFSSQVCSAVQTPRARSTGSKLRLSVSEGEENLCKPTENTRALFRGHVEALRDRLFHKPVETQSPQFFQARGQTDRGSAVILDWGCKYYEVPIADQMPNEICEKIDNRKEKTKTQDVKRKESNQRVVENMPGSASAPRAVGDPSQPYEKLVDVTQSKGMETSKFEERLVSKDLAAIETLLAGDTTVNPHVVLPQFAIQHHQSAILTDQNTETVANGVQEDNAVSFSQHNGKSETVAKNMPTNTSESTALDPSAATFKPSVTHHAPNDGQTATRNEDVHTNIDGTTDVVAPPDGNMKAPGMTGKRNQNTVSQHRHVSMPVQRVVARGFHHLRHKRAGERHTQSEAD